LNDLHYIVQSTNDIKPLANMPVKQKPDAIRDGLS